MLGSIQPFLTLNYELLADRTRSASGCSDLLAVILPRVQSRMSAFRNFKNRTNASNMPASMAIQVCRSVPGTILPMVWRKWLKILNSKLVMGSIILGRTPTATTLRAVLWAAFGEVEQGPAGARKEDVLEMGGGRQHGPYCCCLSRI